MLSMASIAEHRRGRQRHTVERPAHGTAIQMPAAMTTTGSAVACKETAKPVMMLVAWPIAAKETKPPMTSSNSACLPLLTLMTKV